MHRFISPPRDPAQPRALSNQRRSRGRSLRLAMLLAVMLGCLRVADASAVLSVQNHTPVKYALAIPRTTSTVSIFFNQGITPPPAGAVRVAGSMSGLHSGFLTTQDNLLTWHDLSGPFFPGEMVNVNLRSDIVNLGGTQFLNGGYYFAFTIASGAGTMSWASRKGYEASDIPYFIHGGDLDGDGDPDIAAPNEGTDDVSFFENDGLGRFHAHSEYGVGDRPSSIFGEDFDNDGDQDLATADINSGTMSVLLNDGDGSFAPSDAYDAGQVCRQVHGGDFDGDNDIDLCTTDASGDDVYLFLNQGNGNFSIGLPISTVSNGPFAIRCGDYTGDGHLDIAVACQDADSLNIFTNNGLGAFTRTGSYRIADLPWCLNGNDLDGDHDMDLVSVASFSNRICMLLNNGTGGFPTRNLYVTGSFPLGVNVGDLDGDGDIDALSSNYSGGTVGVYRNNGNATFVLQATLACEISGSYSWAHDLDGDLDLDLSVVDEEADSLFIFYNGTIATDVPESVVDGHIAGGLALSPNPLDAAGTFVTLEAAFLQAAVDPIDVQVLDVAGRRVRSLARLSGSSDATRLRWDGRGDGGDLVPAGRYFLLARSGSTWSSAPVLVVR